MNATSVHSLEKTMPNPLSCPLCNYKHYDAGHNLLFLYQVYWRARGKCRNSYGNCSDHTATAYPHTSISVHWPQSSSALPPTVTLQAAV